MLLADWQIAGTMFRSAAEERMMNRGTRKSLWWARVRRGGMLMEGKSKAGSGQGLSEST